MSTEHKQLHNTFVIPEGQTVGKTKPFDADYYGVAFSTIASLALRCQNEEGSGGDDILWAISELSERLSRELYELGAASGDTAESLEGGRHE